MQLLVITIDDCDEFLATLEGLRAHGMNGIVFQSTSLKHALLNSNVDAPPIFGRVSKKGVMFTLPVLSFEGIDAE